MPDTAILIAVSATIGTVVLLAIGLSAGFWAGFQAGARGDAGSSEELADLKHEHAECLAQLAALNSGIRAGHEQSEVVGLLAQSSRQPLSTELSTAIGRMVESMRALERRLHDLEDHEARAPAANPEERGTGWKQPVQPSPPPPQHPMRVQDDDDAPSPTLTTQEMSDLMGGRHKLGESTFEMESRRYPYECVQQLAQWDEGEPLPAKDEYVSVRCHSISVSGISLLWHEPPKFARATLSIGAARSPIYMVIEVKAYKAVYMHESVCYLVQCAFAGRLERATEALSEQAATICS